MDVDPGCESFNKNAYTGRQAHRDEGNAVYQGFSCHAQALPPPRRKRRCAWRRMDYWTPMMISCWPNGYNDDPRHNFRRSIRAWRRSRFQAVKAYQ
jgi:hypothetical protein